MVWTGSRAEWGNNMAKVSVIIPTYNSARFISAAVDSVLTQTEKDWELEIIDDCSKDNTREVLQPYLDKHPNIHYTRLRKNGGVAAARTAGVNRAQGEFVAFLDSDDIWQPEKLDVQLALQEASGADLIYTGARCMDHNGNLLDRYFRVPRKVSAKSLLSGNDIICSSVLVKKEVIQRFPMVRSDLHEDYICWLSILKDGYTAVGIDKPLVHYRLTENSKSRSKLKSAKMTYQVYKYMGIPTLRRWGHFAGYVVHGLKRYF